MNLCKYKDLNYTFSERCNYDNSKNQMAFLALGHFVSRPVPNSKILDLFMLNKFADKNSSDFQMKVFAIPWQENMVVKKDDACYVVGKGENAGYQHFLLFPPHFQKASGCLKSEFSG